MDAMSGAPIGICVALVRIPAIRSDTVPAGESISEAPLYTRLFGAIKIGATVMATGPVPISEVKTMPVRVVPTDKWFVMFPFKLIVMLAMKAVLAGPEHAKLMSPMRSVRPSDRTSGGTALVTHVTGEGCAKRAAAPQGSRK